ncbi:ABC-type transport auxiliary lipoprotein family protein [Cognatilysobacter lacus]|uniref:ABC transporter n=1 Tax=Cognatilysobacter lacus TaxID=1643323 RepID=A0A5D8Z8V9_9GAMM|nr:ABC-type transport auxiliary lipoprotein family protein [Lysobacter lacus]TZF91269.1 ABC transporter [Lysobacter lacus]
MSALPVNPPSAPLLRALGALVIAAALPACSLLGGHKEPPRQFAPVAHVAADASWPRVDAQLTIAPPQIIRSYDTLRIAVRPTPQELQVYKDGVWAQRPSEMLTASLLRTFEDAGRLRAVARDSSGVSGDFRLLLDIRRFEADYAGAATPSATIEVSAKLVRKDGTDVVASRTFLQAEPATDTTVPQVVDAFDRALARVDRDIAGWTLASMAHAHN